MYFDSVTLLRCIPSCITLVAALCVSASAMAQVSAGKVMAVTGSAKAIDAQGRERLLEKGGEIRSGEKIVTGDGALVQVRTHDGGYLSVRSSTEMVLDRFVYDDKDASKSSFLVSLVRGGFRSITGLIGKSNPDAYQIRTSTATVGIRGTDHEPMVIPEGSPGAALLGLPGVYDKVNEGETFIRNERGVLSLKRGDIGFAPVSTDKAPQVLQVVPSFYKMEVKTDAREAADTGDKGDGGKRVLNAGGLLRPSLSQRKAVSTLTTTDLQVDDTSKLKTGTLNTKSLLAEPVVTPAATVVSPTLNTTTLNTTTLNTTTLNTSTLNTTVLTSPTTTLTSPVTTTISPTITAPITTTISPTVITPLTTTVSPLAVQPQSTSTTVLKSTTLLK